MKESANYIRPSFIVNDNEIFSDADLIIEGHVNTSKIDAKDNTVIVSLEAEVNADLQAGVVQIIGKVNGNVSAAHEIELVDTAQVNGDLVAPRIKLSSRARLQGSIAYS